MSAERTTPVRPTPDRPLTPPMANRRPGAVGSTPLDAAVRHGRLERNLYNIVLIDVAGSGSRDSQGLRLMRDDLYGIMAEVTDDNGIDLESVPLDDRGDSLRLILPLDLMAPPRVVDAFVVGLTTALREHRRHVSEAARLRIRMCFDLGVVEPHRRSWTGTPLVRAARLIEAPPLRDALSGAPEADLAAIVSDPVYEIIRERYGYLTPDCFHEVEVRVKEFAGRAWLLAPCALSACPHCAYR